MSKLEDLFERIGQGVVNRPWLSIILSVIVVVGLSMGNLILETENRPERLWIPSNAPSLAHKDYVEATYPSSLRFGSFIATCNDGEDCNMLDATYIQRLYDVLQRLDEIVIDGDAIRNKENLELQDISDDVWIPSMSGRWSYEGNVIPDENNEIIQQKCFSAGPICLGSSILSVFGDDADTINSLTDSYALNVLRSYDELEVFCPMSLTRLDSPCYNATVYNLNASQNDCKIEAPTNEQRINCEKSCTNYCEAICNANSSTCGDDTCTRTSWFNDALLDFAVEDPTVPSVYPSLASIASSGTDGPVRDGLGNVVSAQALQVTIFLSYSPIFYDGSELDPVAEEWENAALCELGIQAQGDNTEYVNCEASEDFTILPFFSRSIGDEFGAEIVGDIPFVSMPYLIVPTFLIIMLSRFDHVHSMGVVGLISGFIVLLSYFGCVGAGALVGVFNTNLTGTLPLLLLGLGVDDAFVLVGEYERYFLANPKSTPKERVVAAAKFGGVSILITSATDALAFLIGSMTVLPALSWFCVMAGFGVILCFLMQLTIFLPVLLLNARRADANRWDCCCCCGPEEPHLFTEPQGCCCCCTCKPQKLERVCGRVGATIGAGVPRVLVILGFTGILGAGIAGMALIDTNFEFEWFLPDGSYSKEYFALNEEYFGSGVAFNVYTQDVDYFTRQVDMMRVTEFLSTDAVIDDREALSDWHQAFLDASDPSLLTDGVYTDEGTFYENLMLFFIGGNGWGTGADLRGNVKWVDPACDTITDVSCDYMSGIKSSRIGATLTLEATTGGVTRYNTLVILRTGLSATMPDLPADQQPFPYTSTFSNWEEVGVIGAELTQNLLITGGVVIIIIFLMIPHPRIAIFVILSIVLSIINLVGFMHWWGLTINGVSTIYILLSCGLAVDYSAHVAHMFVVSTGTSQERVQSAMLRIGPSVFNGIMSTFLAVISLNFTTSYVFVVFARALALTVVFGGSHGLLLLPALLSLFGGSKEEESDTDKTSSTLWSSIELGERPQKSWSELAQDDPDAADDELSTLEYTATLHPEHRTAQTIQAIMKHADVKNRKLKIGGRLWLSSDLSKVIQVLEGPTEAVRTLAKEIEADTRLHGFEVVSSSVSTGEHRVYTNWGMERLENRGDAWKDNKDNKDKEDQSQKVNV